MVLSITLITPGYHQACARDAHASGKGRDDHEMNWHAAAVDVWQAEWDRCEAEAQARAAEVQEGA